MKIKIIGRYSNWKIKDSFEIEVISDIIKNDTYTRIEITTIEIILDKSFIWKDLRQTS